MTTLKTGLLSHELHCDVLYDHTAPCPDQLTGPTCLAGKESARISRSIYSSETDYVFVFSIPQCGRVETTTGAWRDDHRRPVVE